MQCAIYGVVMDQYMTAAEALAGLLQLQEDGEDLTRLGFHVQHSGGTYGAEVYAGTLKLNQVDGKRVVQVEAT